MDYTYTDWVADFVTHPTRMFNRVVTGDDTIDRQSATTALLIVPTHLRNAHEHMLFGAACLEWFNSKLDDTQYYHNYSTYVGGMLEVADGLCHAEPYKTIVSHFCTIYMPYFDKWFSVISQTPDQYRKKLESIVKN